MYAPIKISSRAIRAYLVTRQTDRPGAPLAVKAAAYGRTLQLLADLGVPRCMAVDMMYPAADPAGRLVFGVAATLWPPEFWVWPGEDRAAHYPMGACPALEVGDFIDVIAFDPVHRGARLMLKNADWLGEPWIRWAETHGEKLRVVADPIEWLQALAAKRAAVCHVGPKRREWAHALRYAPVIEASVAWLASEIKRSIDYEIPQPKPKIGFAT